MVKLKALPPTLRERKRYVVFEVLSDTPIKFAKDIAKAIEKSLQNLCGSLGASKAGLIFLHEKYNKKTQRGIVRVSHTSVDRLISAMMLVTQISAHQACINTVGVSGIMKKAISKHMEG